MTVESFQIQSYYKRFIHFQNALYSTLHVQILVIYENNCKLIKFVLCAPGGRTSSVHQSPFVLLLSPPPQATWFNALWLFPLGAHLRVLFMYSHYSRMAQGTDQFCCDDHWQNDATKYVERVQLPPGRVLCDHNRTVSAHRTVVVNFVSLRLFSYITHSYPCNTFEYIAIWKWMNLL